MRPLNLITQEELRKIAELIYEAGRLESQWCDKNIVPELFSLRDEEFKEHYLSLIRRHFYQDRIQSPKEAHDEWVRMYLRMGWKYGEVRDPIRKTHPDLVPYDQLPKEEKDKDATFLAKIWLVKELVKLFRGGPNG